jgi:hypothetical protein
MLRGLQQVGKGNMIRDHHELGKRHNAQGPITDWQRGHSGTTKSKRDNAQGSSTDWAKYHFQGITKIWVRGIMLRGLQQIGQRDHVQESPRFG